jgi:hypothetical protein
MFTKWFIDNKNVVVCVLEATLKDFVNSVLSVLVDVNDDKLVYGLYTVYNEYILPNYIYCNRNVLHIAAINCNIRLLYLCVKFNDIDIKTTSHCDTALHLVLSKRYIPDENKYEITKVLIEMGIDVCLMNDKNYTPLHYACMSDSYKTVKLILQYKGMNISSVVMDNMTLELSTPANLTISKRIKRLLENYNDGQIAKSA